MFTKQSVHSRKVNILCCYRAGEEKEEIDGYMAGWIDKERVKKRKRDRENGGLPVGIFKSNISNLLKCSFWK